MKKKTKRKRKRAGRRGYESKVGDRIVMANIERRQCK